MGNNAFDDLKKRAREDAYADIRQWMFWLPLTPNELTILGAIYAVQIENEDWGDEFALMEERWCSGFPYFRECLAKLLKLGYVRESVNRSGYPSSYLISAKACLEDGESNGYDKENPKIPDYYLSLFKEAWVSGISCQDDCFQVAVVSGRVFDGIDFVFAVDGNPRWRHLGFLVSGRAGNPAEKAWERVRRHPLFHGFSALALIEYQCSPAKAALRVARFGKRIYKVT